MKSIFKKIALVLAFAMVITMLPAKSASVVAAAAEPNNWVRNTCTLYLDAPVPNDKYDTYVSEAYATAATKVKVKKNDADGWGTQGYTVIFTSEDPSIAEVGSKYGLVTAKGIGQTTVTATFSKEGEDDIVESFTVTVKSYAHSIALEEECEAAVNALTVGGDPVTLKAVVADAMGNQETVDKVGGDTKLAQLFTERKYVTDYVKFSVTNPEDKKVLDYDADTNQLKAVAEGEATLTAIAYRWDWTKNVKTNSGWYAWRTATQEYKVTVKEAGIVKAEQTAYNAFELTFDNEEIAKAASDETSKYFTSGSAAVTDKDDIVKVFEVLKNANGDVVGDGAAVIIGGIGQKNDAKNVLSVTMFQELKQNTDYVVYYKNGKANFTTTENIAAGITISQGESIKESIDGVGSTTKINLGIYTYGENGQRVNLDGCVDYDGWRNSVTLEEIGGEQYHPNYSVSTNPSDPYVDFYTDDATVTATVRATLLDYFNEKNPGNPLVDQTVIRIGDYTTLNAKIVDYGVHRATSTHTTDGIYSSKEFAAEDVGMRLFVKLEIFRNSKTEEHFSEAEEGTFTFRSANEDKLIVGEKTGELFPAKEPTNDTVNVFVFYDGQLVGYCPIKVWEKRMLTSLTVEPNSTKMSYNPNTGINDSITLTVKPLDQLKASFMQDVSVTCSVMGAADDYVLGSVTKNQDKTYTLSPNGNGDAFTITFNPTTDLPTSQRSIRIVCTAVYDDGVTKRTLTASTSFSAKNTSASSVSRYDLNLSSTTLDMKLEDKDNGRVSDKKVGITVYTLDREGFKIEQLAVAPWTNKDVPTTGNYITIQKNNEYMEPSDGFNAEGSQKVVFETVKESSGAYVVSRSAIENEGIPVKVNEQFLTVSGAAISQMPHMLEKAEIGNYQVSLYVGGKRVTGAVLQLKDTQPDVIAQKWNQNRVDGSAETVRGVLAAIASAFEFKLGDTRLEDVIYVGEVEIDKATKLPTGKIILNNDIVVHGNSVAIRQVRYLLTHTENGTTYVYELEIPVNKTILVGVTQ